MGAASSGRADVVRLLLAAGARRDARDVQGHTAADYAREGLEFERWRGERKLADMDEGSPKEFSTILLLLGVG